jgi:phage gp36-like protein
MSYTEIAQIRSRLPQVTDEILDDDQIESLLSQADTVINGYLRLKYQLPLSDADSLISYISLELSCAAVLEMIYGQSEPENAALAVRLRERAIGLLESIAGGVILLANSTNATHQPISRLDTPDSDENHSQFRIPPEVLFHGEAS